MCPSGMTCPLVNYCFKELEMCKLSVFGIVEHALGSSSSSSFHQNVNCSRHDIVEQMLNSDNVFTNVIAFHVTLPKINVFTNVIAFHVTLPKINVFTNVIAFHVTLPKIKVFTFVPCSID
jgi:hypothetical protein